jgi:hypothetical protein
MLQRIKLVMFELITGQYWVLISTESGKNKAEAEEITEISRWYKKDSFWVQTHSATTGCRTKCTKTSVTS